MKKKIIIILSIIFLVIISFSFGLFYFLYEPSISLLGDEEVTINVGDNYIDSGATVDFFLDVDKYIEEEGTVDNKTVGEYVITYNAHIPYLSKRASIKRKVHVVDSMKPIITLKGSDVSIYVNSKYSEPGFSATDDIDGDITDKVNVSDNIDLKNVGTYEVTYTVKDSSGNEFSIKRNVIVKERPTTTTTNQDKDGDSSVPTTKKSNGKGKTLPILMYHYFYDPDNGETGENSNWMSTKDFEKQMKYLADNKYYFPSWNEVADFIDGKIALPAKSIVITIDDGQWSFFKYGLPILNKYNIKATSFIITSKAGGTKFKKNLYDNISYQSHTHGMHTGGCSGGHGGLFRCINYDKGLKDLNKSIEILGTNDAIAYPFGDVTNNVLKITKAAGFKVGVTTVNKKAQVGMDRYQLPRVRMSRGISLQGFINSI